MRRLIIAGLVFILAINPATVYAGLWQLLVGMGLMSSGLFMTIDGFNRIEIDKEDNNGLTWPEMIDGYAYKEPEEKIKSGVEGGFGIASICLSSYLLIDYFIDLSKLKKQQSQKIYLIRKQSNTYLVWFKRF